MDDQNFSQLVSMLVKAIQAYCNGHVQFRSCVEVIGHVHLNIDGSVKVDYVLSEEVSKAVSDNGPSFSSHSYLSQPPRHISDISRQFRENLTPSSHSSAQTLPSLNSDPACVNTSTSQRMPIGGTQSVVVHMDGSGEAAVASDQMQVTVSFDGSSVLPIIKQETNVNESEGSLLPETDRQAVQENFLMDCQEPTASQVNIQSALSYREEDEHPAALYSQDSPRSSVSYSHTQEDGQLRTVYSQNTQPVVTSNSLERLNQSPMIQIQEVHSEAFPPVVICPQQNAQPADRMDHLQERYPSRTLQTSVLPTSPPRDSSRSSVSYLQGTGLLQSEQTLQGPVDSHRPSHVSSSDHFQSSATNMSCSTDTGSDTQFGSLCLDVVPMKEEVMDEMPPSPHGSSYPVDSGQERELPDFSNVVIETLGHQVEGTQLIVVREGMQQPQQQPLPFPVLLHAHPGLSPSASPDEVDVRDVPFPVSASGLAVPSCSSTGLPPALSPTATLRDSMTGHRKSQGNRKHDVPDHRAPVPPKERMCVDVHPDEQTCPALQNAKADSDSGDREENKESVSEEVLMSPCHTPQLPQGPQEGTQQCSCKPQLSVEAKLPKSESLCLNTRPKPSFLSVQADLSSLKQKAEKWPCQKSEGSFQDLEEDSSKLPASKAGPSCVRSVPGVLANMSEKTPSHVTSDLQSHSEDSQSETSSECLDPESNLKAGQSQGSPPRELFPQHCRDESPGQNLSCGSGKPHQQNSNLNCSKVEASSCAKSSWTTSDPASLPQESSAWGQDCGPRLSSQCLYAGHEGGSNTCSLPIRDQSFLPSANRPRGRKRPAQPENWKRNVRKRLKLQGKEYESSKGKMIRAKQLGPVDCKQCRFFCSRIAEEDRAQLFQSFYSLGSYQRQKQFICENVEQKSTRIYLDQESPNKRHVARSYFFPIKGQRMRVCKKFFKATLDVGDQFVMTAMENSREGIYVGTDGRGKHTPHNKKSA